MSQVTSQRLNSRVERFGHWYLHHPRRTDPAFRCRAHIRSHRHLIGPTPSRSSPASDQQDVRAPHGSLPHHHIPRSWRSSATGSGCPECLSAIANSSYTSSSPKRSTAAANKARTGPEPGSTLNS